MIPCRIGQKLYCPNSFRVTECVLVYSWLSALESTRWLQHLSVMLKAATLVCSAVEREGRPVLVHCSDGWDRTPQIVALAKILLDPYYRTIEVRVFISGQRMAHRFPQLGDILLLAQLTELITLTPFVIHTHCFLKDM